MSTSPPSSRDRSPIPDEHRPLLDRESQIADNGTIERQPESAEGENDVPIPPEPSAANLVLTLGSTWVGVFLAALGRTSKAQAKTVANNTTDTTIIATLSAPISTSFHSFTLLSWIATGYLIANAALQPLSGRLTDIFGRRSGLLFSNVFFAAGNLICGLAKEGWVIILGRVVAGMGGG